jgi:hypothetical protein
MLSVLALSALAFASNGTDHAISTAGASLLDVATLEDGSRVAAYVEGGDNLVVRSSADGITWTELYNSSLMFDQITSLSIASSDNDPTYGSAVYIGLQLTQFNEAGAPEVESIAVVRGSAVASWRGPEMDFVEDKFKYGGVSFDVDVTAVDAPGGVRVGIAYAPLRDKGVRDIMVAYSRPFPGYISMLAPSRVAGRGYIEAGAAVVHTDLGDGLSEVSSTVSAADIPLSDPSIAYDPSSDTLALAFMEGEGIRVGTGDAWHYRDGDPLHITSLGKLGRYDEPVIALDMGRFAMTALTAERDIYGAHYLDVFTGTAEPSSVSATYVDSLHRQSVSQGDLAFSHDDRLIVAATVLTDPTPKGLLTYATAFFSGPLDGSYGYATTFYNDHVVGPNQARVARPAGRSDALVAYTSQAGDAWGEPLR